MVPPSSQHLTSGLLYMPWAFCPVGIHSSHSRAKIPLSEEIRSGQCCFKDYGFWDPEHPPWSAPHPQSHTDIPKGPSMLSMYPTCQCIPISECLPLPPPLPGCLFDSSSFNIDLYFKYHLNKPGFCDMDFHSSFWIISLLCFFLDSCYNLWWEHLFSNIFIIC